MSGSELLLRLSLPYQPMTKPDTNQRGPQMKRLQNWLTACLLIAGIGTANAAQQPGTWVNITPTGMKMTGDYTDGPIAANVDPVRPSDIYVQAQYDGCYKSTDFGLTWQK